jgi:hypothetical protein
LQAPYTARLLKFPSSKIPPGKPFVVIWKKRQQNQRSSDNQTAIDNVKEIPWSADPAKQDN